MPVLALWLAFFYRWPCAERLSFVDDRIDAGYAIRGTLTIFDAPIKSLFPGRLGRGPAPITSTPILSSLKAHLGHQGEAWSKDGSKYSTTDETSYSPASLAPRQQRFESLVD